MAELGVSVHEGEQLRVLLSGVGKVTGTVVGMIVPGGKCGRSEDSRGKCRENRVKQERVADHVLERYSVDWKMRGEGVEMHKGEPGDTEGSIACQVGLL